MLVGYKALLPVKTLVTFCLFLVCSTVDEYHNDVRLVRDLPNRPSMHCLQDSLAETQTKKLLHE